MYWCRQRHCRKLQIVSSLLHWGTRNGTSNQPEGFRRLFSIPKDPKIQNHVPYGADIFVKLRAQNIREKRNRQDITRTVRIFFNPNPRIFSRSANLPRWLPNSFAWWRYNTLPQLANRNRKTFSSNDTAQAQQPLRHVLELKSAETLSTYFSVERRHIYASVLSKFYWPFQNARSDCE